MNSMAIGGYKSVDAMNPKGGHQGPFAIIAQILDHKNGLYIRPNRVAIKYLDLKTNVYLDAHVRMFNSVVKVNAQTFEEYIINVFNYALRNTTSNWCHNYMLKFLDYIFLKFT
jgi:hypothetical protein